MMNSDKNKTNLQPGKLGNQQRWPPTIDFQQFLPDQKAIPTLRTRRKELEKSQVDPFITLTIVE